MHEFNLDAGAAAVWTSCIRTLEMQTEESPPRSTFGLHPETCSAGIRDQRAKKVIKTDELIEASGLKMTGI